MANLQDANNIRYAQFSGATLPNGELWHEGMDLRQFTHPDHPNFWRSDHPNSPAYGGKDE